MLRSLRHARRWWYLRWRRGAAAAVVSSAASAWGEAALRGGGGGDAESVHYPLLWKEFQPTNTWQYAISMCGQRGEGALPGSCFCAAWRTSQAVVVPGGGGDAVRLQLSWERTRDLQMPAGSSRLGRQGSTRHPATTMQPGGITHHTALLMCFPSHNQATQPSSTSHTAAAGPQASLTTPRC